MIYYISDIRGFFLTGVSSSHQHKILIEPLQALLDEPEIICASITQVAAKAVDNELPTLVIAAKVEEGKEQNFMQQLDEKLVRSAKLVEIGINVFVIDYTDKRVKKFMEGWEIINRYSEHLDVLKAINKPWWKFW